MAKSGSDPDHSADEKPAFNAGSTRDVVGQILGALDIVAASLDGMAATSPAAVHLVHQAAMLRGRIERARETLAKL